MAARADGVVGRFLSWWVGELAALVPERLRGARAERGQVLAFEIDEARVRVRLDEREIADVARGEAGRLKDVAGATIAALDPHRVRVQVRASGSLVLSPEVELPLAAEENLREVLAFEMARTTPFRADDVHFGFRVVERDGARQRLRLRLRVVRRAVVDPALALLRHWDLEPADGAAARRADADDTVLELRPHQYAERSGVLPLVALGIVVALLAAAVLWVPFAEQRAYRAELEGRLREARTAAADAVAVRERLDARREARRLLFQQRAARPSMVELLEALSRTLPDDTYLFRLQLANGRADLHGSSGAASALIATLEANAYLEDVRFGSPVTRDGASARERFHIVADLSAPPSPHAGGGG